MKKLETNLLDCYILELNRFGDERGYFESITEADLGELGFNRVFQISNSLSSKGTLRGLHFQKEPYSQGKVVRCQRGAVLDVVVDLRRDSDSFGKWTSIELTPENGRLLYVPRGFAHGFLALSDDTLFEYYVDNLYMPKYEDGIIWNDSDIGINWKEIFKKYNIKKPILSDKDKNRYTLKKCEIRYKRAPKKYLITGFRGQLGYDLKKELLNRGEKHVLAIDIDEMDITNREQVMNTILEYKPDVIFHCAAWTQVDKAEEMEDKVFDVNVTGTKNITDASISVDATLVYMSTDYIFDGEKEGIYKETDTPNPKSVYGKTKLLGEEEVRRNPKHFITRISWVFGINGNNFIKTMLKLSKTHDKLNVVNDQIGSPTYTVDLAKLLVEMVQTEKYGTYNVNNEGYCSWAEFAKYIMKISGKKTIINPVSTDEYYEGKDMSKIAYRPKNSKLSKDKLVENGFELLPPWQDATERFINELKKEGKL